MDLATNTSHFIFFLELHGTSYEFLKLKHSGNQKHPPHEMYNCTLFVHCQSNEKVKFIFVLEDALRV